MGERWKSSIKIEGQLLVAKIGKPGGKGFGDQNTPKPDIVWHLANESATGSYLAGSSYFDSTDDCGVLCEMYYRDQLQSRGGLGDDRVGGG